MSAPDTNKERDKAAHKTPIIAMVALVIFVGVLLFGLVTWLFYDADNPEGTDGGNDGITLEAPDTDQPSQTTADQQ